MVLQKMYVVWLVFIPIILVASQIPKSLNRCGLLGHHCFHNGWQSLKLIQQSTRWSLKSPIQESLSKISTSTASKVPGHSYCTNTRWHCEKQSPHHISKKFSLIMAAAILLPKGEQGEGEIGVCVFVGQSLLISKTLLL